MFCKHAWEKVVDDYIPSFMDRNPNFQGKGTVYMTMGRKIIILKCTKCGKLDKTVEDC